MKGHRWTAISNGWSPNTLQAVHLERMHDVSHLIVEINELTYWNLRLWPVLDARAIKYGVDLLATSCSTMRLKSKWPFLHPYEQLNIYMVCQQCQTRLSDIASTGTLGLYRAHV